MSKILEDIKLLKKYHTNLVYDYTEYPTKAHWNENFGEKDYKSSLVKWISENPKKKILFYVHTPFCEQLCYFCLCSKLITQDYEKVKSYLYDYLFKEIDMLKAFLEKNKLTLNVNEIYFGGGSPTYYKEEEFKNLVKKLKELFDFKNIGDFSVEIDPRRVNEDKLLFYNEVGVNRLSFGIQDFDINVQKEINRIQEPEIVSKLLTKKVRETFNAINFDLLIGLPAQNVGSIERTVEEVVKLKPTQIQTMYMHYKPQTRKYMIKMLRNVQLPDFYDRKAIFSKASEELIKSGYERAGFESYALPDDILAESMSKGEAYYASLGTQKGEVTNFIAVGSSAHGCLGDDYYFQNFYEQNLYREALDRNEFPIYRGMKLSKDDKIRQNLVKTVRTYFKISYDQFNAKYDIDFKNYFSKELKILSIFEKDGLLSLNSDSIDLTPVGQHFSPQIATVFDKYNKLELDLGLESIGLAS